MSKRSKIKAEYYKSTVNHWKVHNTTNQPTPEYTKWLEDKIINRKQDYVNFFKFFRDNGEKHIGMSIEEFVDEFLKREL